jgi:hypothetical protein
MNEQNVVLILQNMWARYGTPPLTEGDLQFRFAKEIESHMTKILVDGFDVRVEVPFRCILDRLPAEDPITHKRIDVACSFARSFYAFELKYETIRLNVDSKEIMRPILADDRLGKAYIDFEKDVDRLTELKQRFALDRRLKGIEFHGFVISISNAPKLAVILKPCQWHDLDGNFKCLVFPC